MSVWHRIPLPLPAVDLAKVWHGEPSGVGGDGGHHRGCPPLTGRAEMGCSLRLPGRWPWPWPGLVSHTGPLVYALWALRHFTWSLRLSLRKPQKIEIKMGVERITRQNLQNAWPYYTLHFFPFLSQSWDPHCPFSPAGNFELLRNTNRCTEPIMTEAI